MTKKEFSALAIKLSKHLEGWGAKDDLLYIAPLGHTLRGVQLERCSDPRGFYANLFFQPLFVPSEVVFLNLGWRLGGGAHCWQIDNQKSIEGLKQCLALEADHFLKSIRSVDDVIRAIQQLNVTGDSSARKVLAYSFARVGRTKEAIEELERYVGLLNPDIAWQRKAGDFAIQLSSLLRSDETAAQRLLDTWEEQTARSLALAR